MKTMTIDEFEKEVQELLVSLKNGKRQRVQLDIQIVQTKPKAKGWSPEMREFLSNPNPNWHLEPDFLPPKEMDEYYDPFADKEDFE